MFIIETSFESRKPRPSQAKCMRLAQRPSGILRKGTLHGMQSFLVQLT